MANAGKIILYSYWQSSCSWRVRIALNYKDIPHDIRPVSILKKEELESEEFKKVNPMMQVPALKIDGHTLIESLSILHYLEETRTQMPLLPSDPLARAKVREICETIVSGIQPFQNLKVTKYVGEAKRLEWAQHWIVQGFRGLEKLLTDSAGKYCVGNKITLADLCLVPQVFNARNRYHILMEKFPIIERIDKTLEENPAFRDTHPLKQPDCKPEEAIQV